MDNDADPSDVSTPESVGTPGRETHVAGLVVLVAPDARILPVRILDQRGARTVWRLAEGPVFAREHGAVVITLSLSTFGRTRLVNDLALKTAKPSWYRQRATAATTSGRGTLPTDPAQVLGEIRQGPLT